MQNHFPTFAKEFAGFPHVLKVLALFCMEKYLLKVMETLPYSHHFSYFQHQVIKLHFTCSVKLQWPK